MKNKVILITNSPTPYRVPLWNELTKLINLEVICIAKIEKNRNWIIDYPQYIKFLKSYHFFFQQRDWALHITFPFSLFINLLKKNPSVLIIAGYDSIQYWEALLYAKIFNKKVVLWSGTTLLSTNSKSGIVRLLKSIFIKSADRYYTYGTKATQYLESFGVDSSKITTGANTVDTKYFKEKTSNENNGNGITRFLYVGQLINRKGLINTLEAFSKLINCDWTFTIIGTGEQESELKAITKQYHLEEKVLFIGYKQKNEIIDYFSNSDILIMPSYSEVWGLVLNEALASGLFCLSSKYAGATFDLIRDGENGYIIDPNDTDDITQKLNYALKKNIHKLHIKNGFNISVESEAIKMCNAIAL